MCSICRLLALHKLRERDSRVISCSWAAEEGEGVPGEGGESAIGGGSGWEFGEAE